MSAKLADVVPSGKERVDGHWSLQARVQAVALFADLRGFTQMCEKLEVDTVVGLLNEYFAMLTQVTSCYAGTAFNMTGDGLLIGFNVPSPQHDAGGRAVMSALEMLKEFRPIAERWKNEYGIQVGLGIGINRGEVSVGNVGSSTNATYTMIGDTVNVAARLTDLARTNEIVVAEPMLPVVKMLLPELNHELLQELPVKGKSAPLKICRLGPGWPLDGPAGARNDAGASGGKGWSAGLALGDFTGARCEAPGVQAEGWIPLVNGPLAQGFA